MLDQLSVVPRFGTEKGIKGKGSGCAAMAPSTAALWVSLMDEIDELSDATKAMQPRYFYLDLRIRRTTGYVGLRWRTVGRGGTSIKFDDSRFQNVLRQLPVAVQRLYTEWELRRAELNQRATALRRSSMRQHSQQELNQFLLRW